MVCSKKSARAFSSQINSARHREMPQVAIRRFWRSDGCSIAEASNSARRGGGQIKSLVFSIGSVSTLEAEALA